VPLAGPDIQLPRRVAGLAVLSTRVLGDPIARRASWSGGLAGLLPSPIELAAETKQHRDLHQNGRGTRYPVLGVRLQLEVLR